VPEKGRIAGGNWGDRLPLKPTKVTIRKKIPFGKQHLRLKTILSSIVLSQQYSEVYFISFTLTKPLWYLTTKYYYNSPSNLTGWIRPWSELAICQLHEFRAERLGFSDALWTSSLTSLLNKGFLKRRVWKSRQWRLLFTQVICNKDQFDFFLIAVLYSISLTQKFAEVQKF